jgi:hypothetical protein
MTDDRRQTADGMAHSAQAPSSAHSKKAKGDRCMLLKLKPFNKQKNFKKQY